MTRQDVEDFAKSAVSNFEEAEISAISSIAGIKDMEPERLFASA